MLHKIAVQMRVLKAECLDALLVDPSTKTYTMTVHSFSQLTGEQLAELGGGHQQEIPPEC